MTESMAEWSELYTLFKLLADGKLYAADANTNKIPEIYYDVLKVIRSQSNGTLEYCRDAEIKVINAETGEVFCSVPISSFIEQTDKLLSGIRNSKNAKGAFELCRINQMSDFESKIAGQSRYSHYGTRYYVRT